MTERSSLRQDTRYPRKWAWMALAVAGAAGGVILAGAMRANQLAHANPRDMAPSHTKKGQMTNSHLELGSTLTIAKPREEVFAFWRDVANWPQFMSALKGSEHMGGNIWRLLFGDAEEDAAVITITAETAGEHLSWRTEDGAMFQAEGSVDFRDARGDRGTEIAARLSWRPPGGALGKPFAQLMAMAPEKQGRREMKRLKMLMETGEIATARNRVAPVRGV